MMTSHETRSTHSARKAASEQNDLKKLKAKYSSKLPTLQFLFNDWTDDDLLFALEEANGDVDLTIDRISEGRANQWGEVKTKKSKKEAQKQKAATTVSSHQTSYSSPSSSSYQRDTKPTQPRYNDRVSRPKAPVNASSRTRSSKNTSASWDNNNNSNNNNGSASWDNTPSWDTKAVSSQEPVGGGSWASIAKQTQDGAGLDDGWNTSSTAAAAYTTNTSLQAAATDDWAAPLPDTTSADDQPKTWASLLKTKPKPEPAEPVQEATAAEWDSPAQQNVTNEWDAPANTTTLEWDAPSSTSAVNDFNEPAPAAPSWDATEPVTDEWSASANVNSYINTKEQEEQHDAVVSPVKESTNVTSTITELDVKFGSLQVDEEPNAVETIETTSITTTTTSILPETVAQPSSSPKEKEAPVPSVPETVPSPTPAAANDTLDQPTTTNNTYLKEEHVAPVAYQQQPEEPPQQQPQQQQAQVPVQPQIQPQVQQAQQIPQQQAAAAAAAAAAAQPQQQQQPQFGMDHLTSAYSSYLPNQPPAGNSGFGMNPMAANLPDYGIYGTEAAQRAAAMGYYDPTAFSHSPSVTSASAYQSRDKYGQDTAHGQTAGLGQNQNMPQQMYPYYYHYYMPNQFNGYQQSAAAYGQPFMNKSVYPNIYSKPGSSPYGAAAGANTSPYSNASPYANHQSQLYGQSTTNNTYDDLMDYQKSMYNQQPQQPQQQQQPLQGFLGSLNNQPQQQATSQAQPPTQQAPKSDLPRGSNTPQQQPQQPQPQQPMPYTNTQNYFGQPQQMFGYGQYPQQQQQQPQQQQQQQQYQQVPQGQRQQQQYWNQ